MPYCPIAEANYYISDFILEDEYKGINITTKIINLIKNRYGLSICRRSGHHEIDNGTGSPIIINNIIMKSTIDNNNEDCFRLDYKNYSIITKTNRIGNNIQIYKRFPNRFEKNLKIINNFSSKDILFYGYNSWRPCAFILLIHVYHKLLNNKIYNFEIRKELNNLKSNILYPEKEIEKIGLGTILHFYNGVAIPILEKINGNYIFYQHNFDRYKKDILGS